MTKKELKAVLLANNTGKISAEMKQDYPGLHFCPEWDYAAVGPGMTEWEACCCSVRVSYLPRPTDSAEAG